MIALWVRETQTKDTQIKTEIFRLETDQKCQENYQNMEEDCEFRISKN
jgi:hypothetical protein